MILSVLSDIGRKSIVMSSFREFVLLIVKMAEATSKCNVNSYSAFFFLGYSKLYSRKKILLTILCKFSRNLQKCFPLLIFVSVFFYVNNIFTFVFMLYLFTSRWLLLPETLHSGMTIYIKMSTCDC